ncbi:MAG TPA: hypothetical protein VLC49_09430, partial [Solirubrobacteraceae bacterium]|nr:hypothetical protein [Solirubrobacteraceae bacterium]
MSLSVLRPFREELQSDLSPADAVVWLRGEERPFALIGEWLGGLAVLGSAPARVASSDEDPFSVIGSAGSVIGGEGAVRVGGGWVGWLGYGLGARIERLPPSPPAPIPRPDFSLAFYDHVLVHDGERWWFEALWSDERDPVLRERLEVWRRRLATVPVVSDGADAVPTPFRLAANGADGHLAAVADCRRGIEA